MPGGLMHARGRGRWLAATIALSAFAVAVAGPQLAAPAGAAAMGSIGRPELASRPAARADLHGKRRRTTRKGLRHMTAAQKKALLARYIKTHPGFVAAHNRRPGVTLAKRLKLAAFLKAHHQKLGKPVRRTRNAAVRPKRKKKAGATSSWHRTAEFLVGGSVGLMALFLIGSGSLSGPRSRARARAKRRHRTLVTR
jgi:hypothetical protein